MVIKEETGSILHTRLVSIQNKIQVLVLGVLGPSTILGPSTNTSPQLGGKFTKKKQTLKRKTVKRLISDIYTQKSTELPFRKQKRCISTIPRRLHHCRGRGGASTTDFSEKVIDIFEKIKHHIANQSIVTNNPFITTITTLYQKYLQNNHSSKITNQYKSFFEDTDQDSSNIHHYYNMILPVICKEALTLAEQFSLAEKKRIQYTRPNMYGYTTTTTTNEIDQGYTTTTNTILTDYDTLVADIFNDYSPRIIIETDNYENPFNLETEMAEAITFLTNNVANNPIIQITSVTS